MVLNSATVQVDADIAVYESMPREIEVILLSTFNIFDDGMDVERENRRVCEGF